MAQDRLAETYRIVVVGGSTGSIDVLLELLPQLRNPMPFSLVIVVHRKNSADSTLANLLAHKTTVPLREVEDKEPMESGTIYLAPADYHLLVERNETFSLDDSEKVNYSRPSIDVTFESAADSYGPQSVGILLSGANADGTVGLRAISRRGGLVVVQHPETALVAYMPQHALECVVADQVLTIPALCGFINALNFSLR